MPIQSILIRSTMLIQSTLMQYNLLIQRNTQFWSRENGQWTAR
jgi:hypothetical protein